MILLKIFFICSILQEVVFLSCQQYICILNLPENRVPEASSNSGNWNVNNTFLQNIYIQI